MRDWLLDDERLLRALQLDPDPLPLEDVAPRAGLTTRAARYAAHRLARRRLVTLRLRRDRNLHLIHLGPRR